MTAFDDTATVADTPNPREHDYRTHWYEYAAAHRTRDGHYDLIHRSISTEVDVAIRVARWWPIAVVVERVAPDGDWHLWTDTRRGWSDAPKDGEA